MNTLTTQPTASIFSLLDTPPLPLPKVKIESDFMDRLALKSFPRPQTVTFPRILTIHTALTERHDNADDLVQSYLNNRDLGVCGLSTALATNLCLKVREAFNQYNFAVHVGPPYTMVRFRLTAARGETAPLPVEKVAAIFKIDFDLYWTATKAILDKNPPAKDKTIRFPQTLTTALMHGAIDEEFLEVLSNVQLGEQNSFTAAIRHSVRGILNELMFNAVITDLAEDIGFEIPEFTKNRLMQEFSPSSPLKILLSRAVRNTIAIAQYCEASNLSQDTFASMIEKSLYATNWMTSTGIKRAEQDTPALSALSVEPLIRSPAIAAIEQILAEKFPVTARREEKEWQKLPQWLMRVSEGNLNLVVSVLRFVASDAEPKAIVLAAREYNSRLKEVTTTRAMSVNERPITLLNETIARNCCNATNINGKDLYRQFVESLDSSSCVLLTRAVEKLKKVAGKYPRIKHARNPIFEVKINSGPGYRIYFGVYEGTIVLLTAGVKSTQNADIAAADQVFSHYKNSRKH
jgi:putative addiction module killer protein